MTGGEVRKLLDDPAESATITFYLCNKVHLTKNL